MSRTTIGQQQIHLTEMKGAGWRGWLDVWEKSKRNATYWYKSKRNAINISLERGRGGSSRMQNEVALNPVCPGKNGRVGADTVEWGGRGRQGRT